MTEVICRRNGDNYYIRAEGHSGYAPEGRDIVCAALSVLIMSATATLERTEEIRLKRAVVRKGFAELEFSGDKLAEGIYLVVKNGVTGLCEHYPNYIRQG